MWLGPFCLASKWMKASFCMGIMFSHGATYWYLHGEKKDQVGITFVLKRMMMTERRIAMEMIIIFLKCFHYILLRILFSKSLWQFGRSSVLSMKILNLSSLSILYQYFGS